MPSRKEETRNKQSLLWILDMRLRASRKIRIAGIADRHFHETPLLYERDYYVAPLDPLYDIRELNRFFAQFLRRPRPAVRVPADYLEKIESWGMKEYLPKTELDRLRSEDAKRNYFLQRFDEDDRFTTAGILPGHRTYREPLGTATTASTITLQLEEHIREEMGEDPGKAHPQQLTQATLERTITVYELPDASLAEKIFPLGGYRCILMPHFEAARIDTERTRAKKKIPQGG